MRIGGELLVEMLKSKRKKKYPICGSMTITKGRGKTYDSIDPANFD